MPSPSALIVDDLALGLDLRAALLGEPQVVLGQRVLRADRAAEHAAGAARARGARRALAAEVRIGHGLAGLAEVGADARLAVGVLDAELAAVLEQQLVGLVVVDDVGDAEHALRDLVVRRQLGAPVVQRRPLRVVEEGARRHVQRHRVHERAAADAGAAHHEHVLERGHLEDALEPERGGEEVALQVERALRQLVILEPAALLEYSYRVALLGQAQRRNAAAEPASDDHPVDVEIAHPAHDRTILADRPVFMTPASGSTRDRRTPPAASSSRRSRRRSGSASRSASPGGRSRA